MKTKTLFLKYVENVKDGIVVKLMYFSWWFLYYVYSYNLQVHVINIVNWCCWLTEKKIL
jgi:hypothetical protein